MKWIQKRDEKREYVKQFYGEIRFDENIGLRSKAFLKALKGYVDLKGNYIDETTALCFSHETSEGDSDYFAAGIELRICWPAVEEAVIIPLSYEEFYPMLCEECEKYLEERPEDRQQVQELLQKIKAALKV